MRMIIILIFLFGCTGYGQAPNILNHSEQGIVERLSKLTLPQQAQEIRKKVTLELLKSNAQGGPHFFDFLGTPKKSVEDVNDMEGRYGKVQCRKQGEEVTRIYLADDAPPTTLLHFYIHYLQMGQEKRWCELEGRVLESAEKNEQAILYHKFEFEALKTLWDLKANLTMNFEDELLLLEGLTQENKVLAKINIKALDDKALANVGRSLGVLHSQINYLTWLSKTPEDAGSVLQKMEIVNLKACIEGTAGEDTVEKVNSCIAQRCSISKITCQKLSKEEIKKATDDILTLAIAAWTKPNRDLECSTPTLKDEFIDHLQEPSECWKKWYAHHTAKNKDLSLEGLNSKQVEKTFHVPALNIDKEISFQRAPTPKVFIQKAYCYMVFQKTIGIGTIPVDQFGYATQGAIISYSHLKNYRAWLDDKEGETCSKLVKLFTGESSARYENLNTHNKHMLIINPIAALGGGLGEGPTQFKNLLRNDINHQRLHIIFAENKKIQKQIKTEWSELPQSKQADFQSQHSNYDFSDETTILREYFAYTRQEHPKDF